MNKLKFLRYAQWLNLVIMGLFLFEMITLTNSLQGTARVVNYAGLIRGATQQLVKLELSKQPNQKLLENLDTILDGLQNGGTQYHLTKIPDKEYLENLGELNDEWQQLRRGIYALRMGQQSRNDLLIISESHFKLADKVVYLAEQYSDKVVRQMLSITYMLFVLVIIMGIIVWYQNYLRQRQKGVER